MRAWGWVLPLLLLAGCEAPLNLTGVGQERERLLHRYDQFQAATDNGSVLVVVGAGGTVLASSDHGRSWRRRQLAKHPSLIDVTACPDGALGALDPQHRLWVSTDNALSWQARAIPSPEVTLALTCDPQNRFWVVGGFSSIWMSADRGMTWREDSLGEDAQLTAVQFVDRDSAFITGEFGTVLVSRDGGATWDRAAVLPNEFYPQASLFLDRERGWVAGLNGKILYTGDSGKSWVTQSTGSDTSLFGLAAQGKRLFAVGDHGTVWVLEWDEWRSYAHDRPAISFLRAVHPVGNDELLIAGGGGALFRVPTGEVPLE